MVSVMRKAFLEQEKINAEEREAMIKRNLAKIAEDDNQPPPSPTIEEIHAATAPRAPRVVEELTEEKQPEDKKPEDSVVKTSTAADPKGGGQYKTRDLNPKK